MEPASIAIRAAQYAALLTLFGLSAFRAYAPEAAALLRDRTRALAVVGLAAAALAMAAMAIGMTGSVAAAADAGNLLAIIGAFDAGRAWVARMVLLLIVLAAPGLRLPASAAALATLAWSGHGAADEGGFGALHLAADVVHLLAAGVWIGALVAFALLIRRGGGTATARALTRFSGIGSMVVAVLVLTGLVNGWSLAGGTPLPQLAATAWGQAMMVKLVLFAAMLALAAAHRLWLAPRLAADGDPRRLRLSLAAEAVLGFAVVAAVSVLGTLPPPAL